MLVQALRNILHVVMGSEYIRYLNSVLYEIQAEFWYVFLH